MAFQGCGCACHGVTNSNLEGCNSCFQYHQGTIPQIIPESYPQPIIDHTPAMLGKLDKIIELLEKILVEVEMLKKEDRNE